MAHAAFAARTVFLTHLHADHSAGYPDLFLTTKIANLEDVLLDEIRELYKGDVVTGHDLNVF